MSNGVSNTQGLFMLIAFIISIFISKMLIEYLIPTLDFIWIMGLSFVMAIFVTYAVLSEFDVKTE